MSENNVFVHATFRMQREKHLVAGTSEIDNFFAKIHTRIKIFLYRNLVRTLKQIAFPEVVVQDGKSVILIRKVPDSTHTKLLKFLLFKFKVFKT